VVVRDDIGLESVGITSLRQKLFRQRGLTYIRPSVPAATLPREAQPVIYREVKVVDTGRQCWRSVDFEIAGRSIAQLHCFAHADVVERLDIVRGSMDSALESGCVIIRISGLVLRSA